MEEKALDALYGCISSDDAAQIFSSIFASVFCEMDMTKGCFMTVESVSWPRVLLLARRACDSRHWADVHGSERASIESMLHTVLCSPHAAREHRIVAGVLVIVRFLCFCGRNTESVDDMERGYREYEKWLGQVTAGASKVAVQSLCSCLQSLVPIEPPRFLRAHEKVFFRALRLRDIVADYLALARARLSDVDAGSEPGGLHSRLDSLRTGITPRTSAEIARFVAEFTRGGNSLPTSLVRQMNFHRHNFRSVLLEPLLAADFSPPQSILDEDFAGGGLMEFNQQRVRLIKTMAFDRKDKAVKKSEAEHAIAAIKLRMEELNDRGNKASEKPEEKKQLSKDSSMFDLVDGLRLACDLSLPSDPAMLLDSDALQPVEKRIASIIASKLASASRADSKGLVSEIDLFLEAVLVLLAASGACKAKTPEACSQPCYGGHFENGIGWVRSLSLDVLCDLRLARFRRVLQHRILLLLCVPSFEGSQANGAPLGALVYTLCSLKTEERLFDLVYVLVESESAKVRLLSDVVADELPTSHPHVLRQSSMYALSFLKLSIRNQEKRHEQRRNAMHVEGPGKENVAPFPFSETKVCHGDDLPCSQSSTEVPHEHLHFTNGDNSAVAVPAVLVYLLRWMTSSAWRLFAREPWNNHSSTHSSHFRSSRKNVDAEGIALFEESMALLRSPLLSSTRLDPTVWTNLELRAGWGCEANASSVLRRFALADGHGHASIIAIAAAAISIHCSSKHMSSHGIKANGSLPLWLLVALQSLANEAVCRAPIQDSKDITATSASPMMTEFDLRISQGVAWDCARAATAVFLDVLGHLPGPVYFGRSSSDSVCAHISEKIAFHAWPCSKSATRTLVNAYLSWEESHSVSNRSLKDPPLIIVAGLALHWQALKDIPAIRLSTLTQDYPTLARKAQSLWSLVSSAMGFRSAERNQGLSLAEDFRGKAFDFETILDDPLAFALVLVYAPFFALAFSGRYTPDGCVSHFKLLLRKLIDKSLFGLATMLDTIAVLFAILPLSCATENGFGPEFETSSLSLRFLAHTVSARLELCNGDDETLCILGEGTRDWLSKSDDVFSALGFARESTCEVPDLGRLESTTVTADAGQAANQLVRLRLAQLLVRCRIAGALGLLSNEAWANLIRIKDPNRLLSDVVDTAIFLKRQKYDLCSQSNLSRKRLLVAETFIKLVPELEEGIIRSVDRLLMVTTCVTANVHSSDLQKLDPALWRRISVRS